MPINDSVWTKFPELVEKLKEMVQGNPFGAIAKELGHGLTRNAVLGKANRMGFKRPPRKNESATVGKVQRKKERLHIGAYHPITPYIEELDMTPVIEDTEIPVAQRKTVMTIGMYDCRFPVGDPSTPEFFFCGAPKLDDSPYCKHHRDRCITKSVPRYTPFASSFSLRR